MLMKLTEGQPRSAIAKGWICHKSELEVEKITLLVSLFSSNFSVH